MEMNEANDDGYTHQFQPESYQKKIQKQQQKYRL